MNRLGGKQREIHETEACCVLVGGFYNNNNIICVVHDFFHICKNQMDWNILLNNVD